MFQLYIVLSEMLGRIALEQQKIHKKITNTCTLSYEIIASSTVKCAEHV